MNKDELISKYEKEIFDLRKSQAILPKSDCSGWNHYKWLIEKNLEFIEEIKNLKC